MVTKTATPALSDPVSGELKQVLRALKLGKLLDTLPERLTLARQQHLAHAKPSSVAAVAPHLNAAALVRYSVESAAT